MTQVRAPDHSWELIVSPGEVILSGACEGLAAARESIADGLRGQLKDAATPEERAMINLALRKVSTLRPGQTISVGNGTAYALSKV